MPQDHAYSLEERVVKLQVSADHTVKRVDEMHDDLKQLTALVRSNARQIAELSRWSSEHEDADAVIKTSLEKLAGDADTLMKDLSNRRIVMRWAERLFWIVIAAAIGMYFR